MVCPIFAIPTTTPRHRAFAGYRVDLALLARAAPRAVIMHDMPAHRGEEITEGALESDRCVALQQAEDRRHAQRALLATLARWSTPGRAFRDMVVLDNFALFFNVIICYGGALVVLLSMDYLRRTGAESSEYWALVLFATAGMMLMASATDLLVIFLALEVMSLAVYVLTGIRRDSAASTEAAFKYFLLGAFASAFFLYGIAFTYGLTGSTRLDRVGSLMAAQADKSKSGRPAPSGVGRFEDAFANDVVESPTERKSAAEGSSKTMTKAQPAADSKRADSSTSTTKAISKQEGDLASVTKQASRAASLLKLGQNLEKAGKTSAALGYYRRVVKDFAKTAAAKSAAERIKALDQQ